MGKRQRKQGDKSKLVCTHAVSRMVYSMADASRDQPILSVDAHQLYRDGKVVAVSLSSTTISYMMPRSKEQVYRSILPQFSSEVLALIAKAKALGAKL